MWSTNTFLRITRSSFNNFLHFLSVLNFAGSCVAFPELLQKQLYMLTFIYEVKDEIHCE